MRYTHADFVALFDGWAPTYDQTVFGGADGFENYREVLMRVVRAVQARPRDLVVDVGAGTGNLSVELQRVGYRVVAVDPSAGMRREARRKLRGVPVLDGHFLHIPLPDGAAAAAVSTYALHHLDDPTKAVAARELLRVVRPGGRVVIGDIAFASWRAREAFREQLLARGRLDLVEELDTEYYTSVEVLTATFERLGCRCRAEQVDDWVWIVTADVPPAGAANTGVAGGPGRAD